MRARRVGSRPILLGACTVCPTLRLELEEKNITIRSLEKDVAPRPPTVDCLIFPGLIGDMDDLTVEKTNLENENTNLRAILGWVSCHEPQLGMMIKQYQRGDGFGLGMPIRCQTLTCYMARLVRLLEFRVLAML